MKILSAYTGPIMFSVALRMVEKLGKDIARSADPSYWSYENRSRAKKFEQQLPVVRRCFNDLRKASTKDEAVHALKIAKQVINTGMESNFLSRALDVVNGVDFPQHTLDAWMAPKSPNNSRD